jgi:hypothetical protein
VYRHQVRTLPQSERRKQARNSEHVVEMAVRQQQPVQAPKSGAATEQLALRALAAVHHQAMAPGLHEKARVAAVRGGNAGGGAEES